MAETCQLAVHRLEWLLSADKLAADESTAKNPYCSVDPAPPAVKKSVPELRQALLNESLPLFERYRAMFALRNLGSEEAVLALAAGKINPYCWSSWHHRYHTPLVFVATLEYKLRLVKDY